MGRSPHGRARTLAHGEPRDTTSVFLESCRVVDLPPRIAMTARMSSLVSTWRGAPPGPGEESLEDFLHRLVENLTVIHALRVKADITVTLRPSLCPEVKQQVRIFE